MHGQFTWLLALENTVDVSCRPPVRVRRIGAVRCKAALQNEGAEWIYGGKAMLSGERAFRGDAEVSQALVGGSIEISVQSGDGLVNLIYTGQSVIAFYAGKA